MAVEKLQKVFHFSPGSAARLQAQNRESEREAERKIEKQRERDTNMVLNLL